MSIVTHLRRTAGARERKRFAVAGCSQNTSNLSLIDLSDPVNMSITQTITVGGGTSPVADVAVDPYTGTAYVLTNSLITAYAVSNTGFTSVGTRTITMSVSNGARLAIDPLGKVLYACGNEKIVAINIADRTAMTVLSTLSRIYESGCFGLTFDPVNHRLFACVYNYNVAGAYTTRIDVTNPAAMVYQSQTGYGGGTNAGCTPAVSEDGTYLLITQASTGIRSLLAATFALVDLVGSSTHVGTGLTYIDIDHDARLAFVANEPGDEITVIDVDDYADLGLLDNEVSGTNMDGPRVVKCDPVAQIIYVASYIGDEISAYNYADPANLILIKNLTHATNLNQVHALAIF